MTLVRRSAAERFWEKVDKRGPDECWLWTAGVGSHGYGQFEPTPHIGTTAHHFAYELLVGPVPPGHNVDHVWTRGCRSKLCVNPAHLEAVTVGENVRRAYALRLACPQGHPYNTENTGYRRSGHRYCKVCNRMRARDKKALGRGQ